MLLAVVAISVRSQTIVSSDKLWDNYIVYYAFPYPVLGTEHIRFTTDTAINGIVYKNVERSLDEAQLEWAPYGYIRENTNKQVFYMINPADTERLLYDMNLNLHDSAYIYSLVTGYYGYIGLQGRMMHVVSVDSLLVGSTWHKRLNLRLNSEDSLFFEEQWVDSIGSMEGMLHNQLGYVGCDGYTLLCYFVNGDLQYHDPDLSLCFYSTGIDKLSYSPMGMTLYPDPVRDILTIDFDNPRPMNANIEIFDMTGKKRAAIIPNDTRITLDVRGLPPGVYVVRYTGDHEVVQGKIIKE
jgi:hypothetical protein